MSARILNGRAIAEGVRADLLALAQADNERFGGPAGLAILRVGENPSSEVYTRSLLRASEVLGVAANVIDMPAAIDDGGLQAAIETIMNSSKSLNIVDAFRSRCL